MNKRYFNILFVSFLLIIFSIYFIDLYFNLKYGRNLSNIHLKISSNEKNISNIEVYKISPSNNIELFNKSKYENDFFYIKNGYCKSIMINIPNILKNSIKKIEIRINNEKYIFLDQSLKFLFNNYNNENESLIISSKDLKIKKSNISLFKDVINWPGDINYFIIFYIPFFILYLFIIFPLFIIIIIALKKLLVCYEIIDFNKSDYFLLLLNKKINLKSFYFFLVGFILFFSFLIRLLIVKVPYALGDISNYINPAINWFNNGNFNHYGGRSFPYPLFILIILKLFNSFNYISIVQHLIGALTGIILLIVWNNLLCFLNNLNSNKLIKIIHYFIGIILFCLFLFSESVIVYEHTITRESIYPLFLILQVLFLINFIINIKEDNNKIFLWCGFFFINNYFLFVFQPRWGFNLLLNILIYILILFFIRNQKLYKKILFLIIIPFILSFIFIYFPENILMKDEVATESFLAKHLFFGHAKIVDIELEKDINDNNFNKYDKKILVKIREAFNEEFNKNQTKHKFLGYDFNRLVYSGWINEYLINNFPGNEYKKFCLYYFIRSIFKHPVIYLKKILLELSQFYNINGNMYPFHRLYQADYEIYRYSFEKLKNENNISFLPFLIYIDNLYDLGESNIEFEEYRIKWVNSLLFILSKFYLITLVIFFIMFIIKIINYFKVGKADSFLMLYIVVFIIYMYNFFINISIASVYTFDVERYIDDQFILILLSQILAIEIFIITFLKLFKYKKVYQYE